MKYGYKVRHLEEHQNCIKARDGRSLSDDEIGAGYLGVAAQAGLQYQHDARFNVTVRVLHPPTRGLMVILETDGGVDEADQSITRFLVGLNAKDVNLCLIAEPLPPAPAADSMWAAAS